jgi:hypothetical protein
MARGRQSEESDSYVDDAIARVTRQNSAVLGKGGEKGSGFREQPSSCPR